MEALLKRLPFWTQLDEQEREMLRREALVRRYPAGSLLYGMADACLGMIHLLKGELRAYIVSQEGREITLFSLRDGETCVLSASCVLSQIRFETHMEAVGDTEILLIPSQTFGCLADGNIHVRCFSYELAAGRFSDVTAVLQEIIFAPFDRRLSGFLLRAAENGTDRIALTQAEIARQVNSAREVVSRMLRRFEQEGLISVGRGQITILNREGLRLLSGE